jgi:hypothetical protein
MFTAGRILFEALDAPFCVVSRCVWVRLLSILANIIMRRAAQSTHSSDATPTHWTLEILAFDEKSTFDCFWFISALKRGFKPNPGGIRIINFRITTRLQSKSNHCI